MAKKLSLAQRAKKDPKLLARALANPGLRSKLPDSMLPAAQRQQRRTNIRLAQPIVAGSSITERELAKAANAAADVKYGGLEQTQQKAVGEAQTAARDVGGPGGFYDQYLAQIAAHATNVNNIAAQANQAVLGTQNAVTGLAQADLSQLQGQANTGAAQRGMGPAGDLSGMANQAAAIRQALVGSFGAQQAATGAAMGNYADTQARVVAPAQKLSGQAIAAGKVKTAQEAQQATAREKGTFAEQYKSEQRTGEAKNVLAQQIATGKTAVDLAQLKETTRTHKAGEATAQERLDVDRSRIQAELDKANAQAQRAGSKRATTGPFRGLTQSQIDGLSDKQAQQLIDKDDKRTGKGKNGSSGPDWQTLGEQGTAASQATSLKDLAKRAKEGMPFKQYSAEEMKKWKRKPANRAAAEQKIRDFVGPKVKNPILIRAAADAIYDGHLSAYTVKHLISAGYKPSEIASALSTKTHGDWVTSTPAGQAWARDRARTKTNTQSYGNQGNLGRSGHK